MACCCIPTIAVTGVSVNTTTNVATLSLNSLLPTSGKFRLLFSNCGGSVYETYCVTPCTNPQATVQFLYTPSSGTATTYATVYNCPSCGCGNPGLVYLSSFVKRAARNHSIVNGVSSYSASGAIFITDRLPVANVSYTTTAS